MSTIHNQLIPLIDFFYRKKTEYKKKCRENCRKIKMSFIRKYKDIPNEDISIMCNNCIAGCVLHDFGLRFNSPTVNLIIEPDDYVEFLSHLEYYSKFEVVDYPQGYEKYNCPSGILADRIHIYFIHYHTFSEAKKKWQERVSRINYNNLFFVLSEKDGCTLENLKLFDNLDNCRKKIAFVHKQYQSLTNIFVVKEDPFNSNEVAVLTDWIGWFGRRAYDVFDWRTFLLK